MTYDFAIVIPTYKRPDALAVCVDSILLQSLLPRQLIIVDDDELPQEVLADMGQQAKKKKVELVYIKKDHKKQGQGSAYSRNIGISASEYPYTFIFDDDMEPESDFCEHVMRAWREDASDTTFAVAGVWSNNRVPGRFEYWYHYLNMLGRMDRWDINDVGFQTWNDGIKETMSGNYAHGSSSVYKTSILRELGGFATFSGGRTALEDVEYFWRAKKAGYSTLIVPKARLVHHHSPLARENHYQVGYKEGYNRTVIYRTHSSRNLLSFLWFVNAQSAWIFRKVLVGQFAYAYGLLWGSFSARNAQAIKIEKFD